MSERREPVTVNFRPEQLADLRKLAEQEERTLSAQVRHLVARAEAADLVLTSYMVKLRCESLSERLFIPAFVYFFQMLYPFAWRRSRRNDGRSALT